MFKLKHALFIWGWSIPRGISFQFSFVKFHTVLMSTKQGWLLTLQTSPAGRKVLYLFQLYEQLLYDNDMSLHTTYVERLNRLFHLSQNARNEI